MPKDKQRVSLEKHEIAYCRKTANWILKTWYNPRQIENQSDERDKEIIKLARVFLKITSKKKSTKYGGKNVRNK